MSYSRGQLKPRDSTWNICFSCPAGKAGLRDPRVPVKEHEAMHVGEPEETTVEVFIRPWCRFIIRLTQKDKVEESKRRLTYSLE